jgi:hypothetical protein
MPKRLDEREDADPSSNKYVAPRNRLIVMYLFFFIRFFTLEYFSQKMIQQFVLLIYLRKLKRPIWKIFLVALERF